MTKKQSQFGYLDLIDGALIGIDLYHHEIHASNFFTAGSMLSIGTPTYFALQTAGTAQTKKPHLTISVGGNKAGNWYLYENPTINAGSYGAITFPLYNHMRTSIGTSLTRFVKGTANPTTLGTQTPWGGLFGGSGLKTTSSGESGIREEIILNPAWDYLLRVVPDDVDTVVNFILSWYEE